MGYHKNNGSDPLNSAWNEDARNNMERQSKQHHNKQKTNLPDALQMLKHQNGNG